MGILDKAIGAGKKLLGQGKNVTGLDDYNIQEDPYGRNQQVALTDMMMARAKGQTPSIAQEQVRQGMQQNQAGINSTIRGMGGINNAMKQRMMINKGAQIGQDIAQQGGLARMQEQMETEKSMGGLLAQMRDADLGREKMSMESRNAKNDRKQSTIRSIGQAAIAGG